VWENYHHIAEVMFLIVQEGNADIVMGGQRDPQAFLSGLG
jgi:hypothetical protein